MTTPSSFLSGAGREALFDEIEKISESIQPPQQKKQNVKKALTGGLGFALGYGAGHVGGMLGERALAHVFKDKWHHLTPVQRHAILYPALGASSVALMALNNYAQARREQALNDE